MCRYGRVAMVRGWLAAPCGDEGWSGEFAERQARATAHDSFRASRYPDRFTISLVVLPLPTSPSSTIPAMMAAQMSALRQVTPHHTLHFSSSGAASHEKRVHRHRDRRVPELLLDRLWMGSQGDEE